MSTTDLTLAEYQVRAWETALPTALNDDYLIPGLAAEAGEVAGKFAKGVRDGFSGTYVSEIKKELGDVLWFVALIADVYGIPLESVAQGNLDKLASRKERGVLGGSGDNR